VSTSSRTGVLRCFRSPFILSFGFVLNVVGFQDSSVSAWAVTDTPMIALPAIAFFFRQRKIYATITAVYVPLLFLDLSTSLTW
jgi:hypothetical protein